MLKYRIIKNQRGKEILVLDGFTYNIDDGRKNGDSWRCTRRGCIGRLIINKEKTLTVSRSEHSHGEEDLYSIISKNFLINTEKYENTPFDKQANIISKKTNADGGNLHFEYRNARDYFLHLRNKKTITLLMITQKLLMNLNIQLMEENI